MKKQLLILSVAASTFFVSCSDEEIITSNEATLDFELAIKEIDFNPETAQPEERFNSKSDGLYHGILVTLDTEIHGKIWINVNNDGNYNATVVTNQDDRFRFLGQQTNRTGTQFIFKGERGSFNFDISDIDQPKASNVIIDAKEGHISSVKDRAGQRAAVILGSFQTNDDDPTATPPLEAITGTWDLITDGTPNTVAFGFPLLTEVVITVANNGNVFTDTDFETFEYPCFFFGLDGSNNLVTEIEPVFLHEDPLDMPNGRNEFWAQDQSFQLGNAVLTYWLGQSSGLVDINGAAFADHGFHNNNFATPPVAGCTEIDGQKGVWNWNGRSGFSTFDDPFDVPMTASRNANYQAFQQMLREVK